MSHGINKVILVGNIGNDPEIRQTTTGGQVAHGSLATSEAWKDKQSGEQKENTEWHRVIFFNRLAEIVGQYCKKGSKLYIGGKIQTRKWIDKEGQDRYTTEIVANEMQMLDSLASSTTATTTEQATTNAYRYKEQSSTYDNNIKAASSQSEQALPFFSNEIPF